MQSTPDVPSPQPALATQQAVNLRSVGLILTSVVLGGIGQLAFKAGLNQIGGLQLSLDMFVKILTTPMVLLGLAVFAVSALLWLIALMSAELSFAYPFLSFTYVIVLVGGALLFGEQITALRLLGFGVIITGIFIVARSEQRAARK